MWLASSSSERAPPSFAWLFFSVWCFSFYTVFTPSHTTCVSIDLCFVLCMYQFLSRRYPLHLCGREWLQRSSPERNTWLRLPYSGKFFHHRFTYHKPLSWFRSSGVGLALKAWTRNPSCVASSKKSPLEKRETNRPFASEHFRLMQYHMICFPRPLRALHPPRPRLPRRADLLKQAWSS